jgi:hypothetical protein
MNHGLLSSSQIPEGRVAETTDDEGEESKSMPSSIIHPTPVRPRGTVIDVPSAATFLALGKSTLENHPNKVEPGLLTFLREAPASRPHLIESTKHYSQTGREAINRPAGFTLAGATHAPLTNAANLAGAASPSLFYLQQLLPYLENRRTSAPACLSSLNHRGDASQHHSFFAPQVLNVLLNQCSHQ